MEKEFVLIREDVCEQILRTLEQEINGLILKRFIQKPIKNQRKVQDLSQVQQSVIFFVLLEKPSLCFSYNKKGLSFEASPLTRKRPLYHIKI